MRTSLWGVAAGAALHCLALFPDAAPAHEFWIEPARAAYAAGETVKAELKVGVELVGEPWPYLSSRFRTFTVANGGGPRAVEGAEGDLPALDFTAAEPGLHAVAHETVAFRTIHEDWPAFADYLAMEGLARAAAEHRRRGLPRTGFAERYIRHARALVQVGEPQPGDTDRPSGMAFEIVAEDSPFRPGLRSLPVRLTRDGRPLPDHQITLYAGTTPAERTVRCTS